MPESKCLDTEQEDWPMRAFRRAYCGDDGPFEQVCRRLEMGFSVLVYLPGNCMSVAAQYVDGRSKTSSGGVVREWKEFLLHPGKTGSFADVLSGASDSVARLIDWLTRRDPGLPGAIFHNLDLLCERGGIYHMPEAQMALFSILEGTRRGVVLGLSDREAGRLPPELERAFPEKVWLDEITFESFPQLIPLKLQETLGSINDGAAWLIASRLRWSDPLRAVKIMLKTAERQDSLPKVLNDIWLATRPVEFRNMPKVRHDADGFPPDLVQCLKDGIVNPFNRWKQCQGADKQEAMAALRKLPPGVILYGPPGTGKTELAKWLASAVELPLRVVTAAEIKSVEWGEAEKRVHRIFAQARRASPCILLFDEADDVFPDRRDANSSVASSERGIVDAALQELEGFEGRPAGVLVVMTTNRFTTMDQAIRSKLRLHQRVPYPLTKEQVGKIVTRIALHYRFKLSGSIHQQLVDYFMGSILSDSRRDLGEVNIRRVLDDNLFSPREIQQAMLLLDHGIQEGEIEVTDADVARLKNYYEQLRAMQGPFVPPGAGRTV